MTRLTEHPLVERMERETGEVLTANQRAFLSALAETETGLEAVADAVVLGMSCDNHGKNGLTLLGNHPNTHCQFCRPTAVKMLEAAAPLLTAPLRAELARVREERDEALRLQKAETQNANYLSGRLSDAEREAASLREALEKADADLSSAVGESSWVAVGYAKGHIIAALTGGVK